MRLLSLWVTKGASAPAPTAAAVSARASDPPPLHQRSLRTPRALPAPERSAADKDRPPGALAVAASMIATVRARRRNEEMAG